MAAITNWPNTPGLPGALAAQGLNVWANFDGTIMCADEQFTAVQAIVNSYSGSAGELQYWQAQQQAALDALFDAHFDLAKFIRGGTVTTITATNVGNFLAQIANNYRSLRAQIATATSVVQVRAININGGWPSNP